MSFIIEMIAGQKLLSTVLVFYPDTYCPMIPTQGHPAPKHSTLSVNGRLQRRRAFPRSAPSQTICYAVAWWQMSHDLSLFKKETQYHFFETCTAEVLDSHRSKILKYKLFLPRNRGRVLVLVSVGGGEGELSFGAYFSSCLTPLLDYQLQPWQQRHTLQHSN